ncbi:hypothetical protein CC1G_14033 [Coprinopsis cinerea okayama7|uniref:Uncharacterized protein n=1 Tax=Coprinopsis cinerea (strain Okayama-7 / 130 / ATCC MYA-4618 / FGSC 9003) TaxID=240176 RepID=D6RKU7_COPC7|nr:hypothetical protein CC1G_14033 [Coprinopsis cinerea okayama7\|eukprot:XP_002911995.1 hypothetical protein CC1G_14033 [Coprinopsis cinerea okayama7\
MSEEILSVFAADDAPDQILAQIKAKPEWWVVNEFSEGRILYECVLDMITSTFNVINFDTSIHPENGYLVGALVSGACTRSGLLRSYQQSGEISSGLQFPDEGVDPDATPEREEMKAIHACLHLLAWGYDAIVWNELPEVDLILPALLAIEQKGIIKHPGGRNLLERTIKEARNNFPEDIPLEEIWSILFPQAAADVDSPCQSAADNDILE